ncbi:hypothetical protein [Flavobacterium sp. 3HN19-14]|uniref:hypothetical protein n=1 Tax=Flavobacterium sp. 3HN19-14 TaxID=3448133 RepID=UPI003EDEBCE6
MITHSLKNPDQNTLNALAFLDYHEDSLGFGLGCFLLRNNLSFEKDDTVRVLAGYDGSFLGEICLQYFLFGNGRRNFLSVITMLVGTLSAISHCGAFYTAFKKGRNAHRFHDLDFSKMLSQPLENIWSAFNIL